MTMNKGFICLQHKMEIKIYDNKLFKGSASRAVKQYIIKILISGGGIVQKNFFHNMFYSET